MIAFALWCGAILLPFVIWFLFRKGGYKRTPLDAPPPGPEWKPSGERFVDPTSGETLDVWFHEPSGERAYVRSRNQGT